MIDTIIEPKPGDYSAADSVVLERTACFGACPAYRVSIARSGVVYFESLNPNDSGSTRHGHIDPERFRDLITTATFARFFSLPDVIGGDAYCGSQVTDVPTVTVSVFLPNRRKTIADYLGCLWGPMILRNFESEIDEVAGTRRWARPPRYKKARQDSAGL